MVSAHHEKNGENVVGQIDEPDAEARRVGVDLTPVGPDDFPSASNGQFPVEPDLHLQQRVQRG